MARLLGIMARQPIDISLSIGQPQHVMMSTHGWGAAWYERKKLQIKKGIRSAVNPAFNQPVSLTINTTIFLFHMRQATSGDVSERNTHPFSYKNYTFAHNGSVNKEALLQKLVAPYNKDFQSEPIDSEVYFRFLIQEMSNSNAVEGIGRVTEIANNPRGANFLLTNGETLYAYRYGLPLYWFRWNRQEQVSIATQTGVQLTSTMLAAQPAFIISSEKLFDANWTAMDDGELFIIQKNLQYESIRLA